MLILCQKLHYLYIITDNIFQWLALSETPGPHSPFPPPSGGAGGGAENTGMENAGVENRGAKTYRKPIEVVS